MKVTFKIFSLMHRSEFNGAFPFLCVEIKFRFALLAREAAGDVNLVKGKMLFSAYENYRAVSGSRCLAGDSCLDDRRRRGIAF